MLQQNGDVFRVLKEPLQVIQDSGVTEHAHLDAARALFKQLLGGSSAAQPPEPSAHFKAVMDSLTSPPWIDPTQVPILSAEQAAFRFSSALLILDDIIASTVLQEEPTLYEYYHSLLCGSSILETGVGFEAGVGCQNWALL
ncbi:hypothetical protein INS49_007994 [Diaporthe citri]|uniref:uncharacterized protein n=1 Tax=Diaporthe citri TaxID=83186 RepID=UPI001C7E25DD|nr:uncharacterized protein INS49_007994 [Diaporthe citri]KAG6362899.1 hypothetical protein INS49_007994 [Diaporthe citri]